MIIQQMRFSTSGRFTSVNAHQGAVIVSVLHSANGANLVVADDPAAEPERIDLVILRQGKALPDVVEIAEAFGIEKPDSVSLEPLGAYAVGANCHAVFRAIEIQDVDIDAVNREAADLALTEFESNALAKLGELGENALSRAETAAVTRAKKKGFEPAVEGDDDAE